MARRGWSTSNFLTLASGVVTGPPFTIAAWAKTSITASEQYIAGVYQSSSTNNRSTLRVNSTKAIEASTVDGSTESTAVTSTLISAGTWFHACGVFASITDRRAFLNGAGKGTNAVSRTMTGVNQTRVGVRGGSTLGSPFAPSGTGDLAEVAIWNVALTDADVASLANAVAPFLVRPDALVAYWPITGFYSPENNLKSNSSTLSITGALSQSPHPRVFDMTNRMPRSFKAAVAADTLFAQAMM